VSTKSLSTNKDFNWTSEAELELNKIPSFVRGKIKRNTEISANKKNNIAQITIDVMYAAKEQLNS
jgi:light-independent protochlorophyllide reductase subunit B